MVDETGMFGVHAFIHGGSSGGPVFIWHKGRFYVAGIVSNNPKCREWNENTQSDQWKTVDNLACFRSVHAPCLPPQLRDAVHA